MLQINETQHRLAMRYHHKGIREGQGRPGHRYRAQLTGHRIMKEHAPLSPDLALGQKHKGLATIGMEGVGDGEMRLAMWVIRCS